MDISPSTWNHITQAVCGDIEDNNASPGFKIETALMQQVCCILQIAAPPPHTFCDVVIDKL